MRAWLVWIKARLFYVALCLWSFAVAVVCIRVARHPGAHSAFRGVRVAGASWLHQGRLYGADTGFLYSPLIAALHVPFELFPEGVSEVLWRLLIGILFPLALWLNARALFRLPKEEFGLLLLLTLPLTLNTLNNGQSNIVLVILFLCATAAAQEARWWCCAVCSCFAIYWKLYPVALALLLVLLFPKKLSGRVVLGVIVLFALPFLLQNWPYVIEQYGSWMSNLLADQRGQLEYYGKNRDFYLLLRLFHLTVSKLWWTILQLLAAVTAAAACYLAQLKGLSRATTLFCALSLATIWMLLFGPATEAATYVLIAVPSAYLLIFGWSSYASPAAKLTSTFTYAGFVLAEVVNSWLHIKRNIHLVHAIQPLVALCFCAALFCWWKQHAAAPESRLREITRPLD